MEKEIEISEEELRQFLKDKGFLDTQIRFVFNNFYLIRYLPLSEYGFDGWQIRYLFKLFSNGR